MAKPTEPETPAPVPAPDSPPAPKQRTPEEAAAKAARLADRQAAKEAAAKPPAPAPGAPAPAVAAPHKALAKRVDELVTLCKAHPPTLELQTAVRKLTAAKAALEADAERKPEPEAKPLKW